jgi:hypothetical protein
METLTPPSSAAISEGILRRPQDASQRTAQGTIYDFALICTVENTKLKRFFIMLDVTYR